MRLRVLLSAFVVSAAFMLFAINVGVKETRASEECTASIGYITQPANQIGNVFNGVQEVKVSTVNTGVSMVLIEYDGRIIGRAKNLPIGTSQWAMQWDTRFTPNNDPAELRALIFNETDECETEPVEVEVINSQNSGFFVDHTPPDYFGPTGSNIIFDLQFGIDGGASGANANIAREFAYVDWSVESGSPGFITPLNNHSARYFSGPSGGSGLVEATVYYGGIEFEVYIPVEVYPQSGGSDPGSNGGNNGGGQNDPGSNVDPNEPQDPDDENQEPGDTTEDDEKRTPPKETFEKIKRVVENNDEFQECVDSLLGEDYDRIIDENRRPNTGEFRRFLPCFATQNYVIPSILSPVPPEEVREVKESKKVEFRQIKNEKKVDELGNERVALVLSGTTEPNTDVLIYVFSEPLVLATVSDDEGNWSYSLEDPLESGEHEVYALVEKGDGEYERSSVASFVIGEAEATEENPNGYSLELLVEPTITASNRSINLFIAVLVGLVSFSAIVVVSYIVQKRLFATPPASQVGVGGVGSSDNDTPFGIS